MNDEIMGALLANAHKDSMKRNVPEVRNDVTEEEALRIFNEVVEVYKRHDLSYQCATRITMALNEAFISGAVELYRQEMNKP